MVARYLPGSERVRIQIIGDFSAAFLQANIEVSKGFLDDLGS